MARNKFYDDEDFEQRDRKRDKHSPKEMRRGDRQRKMMGQTEWQQESDE